MHAITDLSVISKGGRPGCPGLGLLGSALHVLCFPDISTPGSEPFAGPDGLHQLEVQTGLQRRLFGVSGCCQ